MDDAAPPFDARRTRQQQQQPVSNALLSRVAESIFWVGRYVERAEGTARILDVVVYQALEQSGAASDARRRAGCWR